MTLLADPRTEKVTRAPLTVQAPPGFANKLARGIWSLVWLLLYRPSPRPLHGWRRLLLRIFGARVGAGAKPYPSARIWAPWNLTLGANSTLGDDVDCYSVAHIHLGEGAVVSQRAFLCTAQRDVDRPGNPLMVAPIVLSDQAWVAAEAYVAAGVTLGEGAVAAARTVVTRDIQSWQVVAGNPARVIRQRKRPV
ncbi:MAG: putative colanic acid biosynthesis acetyltransferase [Pseudomonadota bacterium]